MCKFLKILIWLMRVAYVVTAIMLFFVPMQSFSDSIATRELGGNIQLLVVSLIITFIPEIYTWISKVKIPITTQFILSIFVFGAQYLGSFWGAYIKFSWWDIMLHLSSGFFLGYLGIIIIYSCDKTAWLFKNHKTVLVCIIVFCVAMTGAGIWEMIEFAGDTFLGTNAQLGSLQDTMEDIICGFAGGIVSVIYIAILMKKGNIGYIKNLLDINKN